MGLVVLGFFVFVVVVCYTFSQFYVISLCKLVTVMQEIYASILFSILDVLGH